MDDTKREALAGLLVGLVPANDSRTDIDSLLNTEAVQIRERSCP